MLRSHHTTMLAYLLCVLVDSVVGRFDHVCTSDTRSDQAALDLLCSSGLADVLAGKCEPHGYAPGRNRMLPMGKRRPVPRRRGSQFLPKEKALSYLSTISKRQGHGNTYQNIICECCLNSCTTHELMEYCNPPPASTRKRFSPMLMARVRDTSLAAKPAPQTRPPQIRPPQIRPPQTRPLLLRNLGRRLNHVKQLLRYWVHGL